MTDNTNDREALNTDITLFTDSYGNRIFAEQGSDKLGIEVGGYVCVRSLKAWHARACTEAAPVSGTVPWPKVTAYSGGASAEGVAGRVWLKLTDGSEEVEYVPAAPVSATSDLDWRTPAAAWLRRRADEQEASNARYPAHAAVYPEWKQRILRLRWLADDLDREASESPYGVPMAQPAQAPTQQIDSRWYISSPTCPAEFKEYVAKNYNGEVVFHDPAWHAEKLWRAACWAAQAPSGVDEAKEREAFETWVTESGAITAPLPALKRDADTGGYWFSVTDAAWLSWRARSAWKTRARLIGASTKGQPTGEAKDIVHAEPWLKASEVRDRLERGE